MTKTGHRVFMAIDQYGNTHHGLTHPRKELLEIFGRKHASKTYRDLDGGGSRHVGYVIGRLWLEVFEVLPWHASPEGSSNE